MGNEPTKGGEVTDTFCAICLRPVHYVEAGELWEHPSGEQSASQWLHAGDTDNHEAVVAEQYR